MGSAVLGRAQAGDAALVRRHLFGWTVKAFFLPLMAVYLKRRVDLSVRRPAGGQSAHHARVPDFLSSLLHRDLLFCVVGYSTTMRLFDSQIRSVEPTVAGWLVALMCYQPFYSVIGRFYLQYDDATYWDNWLEGWPGLRAAWAGDHHCPGIDLRPVHRVVRLAIFQPDASGDHHPEVHTGSRNIPLTWRKNFSWWLISVPFISELGWSAALRNCCLLALLNLVYFARARTESGNLSRDPTYVAYAFG